MDIVNQEIIGSIKAGKATQEQKIEALKAVSQMPPASAIEIFTSLWEDPDSAVSEFTKKIIREIPEENIANFILMEDVNAEKLDQLSKMFADKVSILEAIILNPTTSDATIKHLATFCESGQLELILLDKPRLSRVPSIMDDVLSNARLTTELRTLIEKDKTKALGNLYPSEFMKSRPAPKLLLTSGGEADVDDVIAKAEQITNEEEREKTVQQQLLTMNIPQKIQYAIKGPREARIYLVRDANKIVAAAVLKSPKVSDSDVEGFAKMRNVSEDILRQISETRHWMRNLGVVEALAKNPKTPVPVTIRLLPRLSKFTVRKIAVSKDVPEAVQRMALKLSQQR
jgi:hypothetical protein